MSVLSRAVKYVEQNHPLPRCTHGQALRDHSGERLAPPCGCGLPPYRTTFIDYDARREPKTDRFCVRCQKDIKTGSPARVVHFVDGNVMALHPEDEALYAQVVNKSGDGGMWLLGMDCARIVGLEWSVSE